MGQMGSSDQIIHLEAATMLKMTLLLIFLLTQIFGTNGGSLPQQETDETCAIAPNRRIHCGWNGISEATCTYFDCCYDAMDGKCYHKIQKGRCNVDVNQRRNCGYSGISSVTCENRGCCFEDSIPGDVIWCYYSN